MAGDGDVTGRTWKWERSRSRTSGFVNIGGEHGTDATSTYTPTGADVSSYLRATASYDDVEGPDKTAMMVTKYAVEAEPDNNAHPAFPDQDTGTEGIQTAQTRTVPEKTPAGEDIGDPRRGQRRGQRQTDLHPGRDRCGSKFSIDPATGQLKTRASLDFEADEGCR